MNELHQESPTVDKIMPLLSGKSVEGQMLTCLMTLLRQNDKVIELLEAQLPKDWKPVLPPPPEMAEAKSIGTSTGFWRRKK